MYQRSMSNICFVFGNRKCFLCVKTSMLSTQKVNCPEGSCNLMSTQKPSAHGGVTKKAKENNSKMY